MMRRVNVVICLTFGLCLTGCGTRDGRGPTSKPNRYDSDEDVSLVWRELGTLRHGGSVLGLAFSPDGKWLATGSVENASRVWSVGDWRQAGALSPQGTVYSVAFSPDGKWMATGRYDGSARIWSVGDWREVCTLKHYHPVTSLVFSPDGKWLASGGADNTARVWSVGNWREEGALRHHGLVYSLAFSPDGKWLATGGADNTGRVWSVGDWRQEGTLTHYGPVYSLAFSPDGTWLATGSDDNTAKVWSVGDWRQERTLKHGGNVYPVAFSPDGRWLATGSDDNTTKVWSVGDWRKAETLEQSDDVSCMAFSPDSNWLVTGSSDGTAKVWCVGDWLEAGTLEHSGIVRSARFSPDGKWLATGSGDSTAKVWATGRRTVRGAERFRVHNVDIDWHAGSPQGDPFPERSVETVTEKPLATGHPAKARVTVSNEQGRGDVFRVFGIVHAPETQLWHGRKIFFGHVPAGKSFTRVLELPTWPAWPSGTRSFRLNFQEWNHIPPAPVSGAIEIFAQPRPRLSTSFSFGERKSYGDRVSVRVRVDHSEGTWDLSKFLVRLKVSGLVGGDRTVEQTIEDIRAGQTRTLSFGFANWKQEPDTALRVRVECAEARDVVPEPLEEVLDARPLVALFCTVRDPKPANEDGILQTGESAECVVRIQNEGKATTGVIRFALTDFPDMPGLHAFDTISGDLPALKPGEGHSRSFKVQPSHAFGGQEITFRVVAEDDIYGTRTERQVRLEVGEAVGKVQVQALTPRAMVVRRDGTNAYAGASQSAGYLDSLEKDRVVTVNGMTPDFYRIVWRDKQQAWVLRDTLGAPEWGGTEIVAPPWLAVAEPTAKVVSERELPVRLTAGAPLGLAKLQIFVGQSSDPQVQQLLGGKRQEWAAQIVLPEAAGVSAMRFVVTDRKGQQEEQVRHVRYDPQVGDLYRKAYAVVIGTNYRDWPKKHQLDYAERDAKGMERVLREHFLFTEIRSLYGGAATQNNMERLLFDWLPSQAERDDAVLVYFAGHGITDNNVGYLVPHDGSCDGRESSRNLMMFRLKEELARRCQAKAMMVVVDACFAGLLATEKVRNIVVEPRVTDELARLRGQKARVVITAGGAGETVLDGGSDQHSVFTGALLDALRRKGIYTTSKRVFSRVREVVVAEAQKREKKQEPQYGQWSWDDDPCEGHFVFVRR